jgi:hypothetical protein
MKKCCMVIVYSGFTYIEDIKMDHYKDKILIQFEWMYERTTGICFKSICIIK